MSLNEQQNPAPPSSPGSDPARQALAQARARARSLARGTGTATTRRTRSRTGWRPPAGNGADQRSSPAPDGRDPQLLASSLEGLVRDRGWDTEVRVGDTLSRWGDIVGPEIAEHARPDSFVDGVLTVRADSTAWATQLRLLMTQVRKRLDAELGHGVVERIVVAGPSAPTWRHGRFTVPGRGPRDTYG